MVWIDVTMAIATANVLHFVLDGTPEEAFAAVAGGNAVIATIVFGFWR